MNLAWPALKKGLMMVDLKMFAMAVPTAAKLNGAAAIAVAKHLVNLNAAGVQKMIWIAKSLLLMTKTQMAAQLRYSTNYF